MKSEILFDIANLEQRLRDLEEQTLDASFWEDSKKNASILKEINQIKSKIEAYQKVSRELAGVIEMNDLLLLEPMEDMLEEVESSSKKLEKEVEKLEISTLLSGKYDQCNAIITLHPGAGGTEAQDWAEMLYRMYTRWANDNGY
mgnify:FL=1